MSNYNDYVHAKHDSDYSGILHNYQDIYTLHVSSINLEDNKRPGYLIDNVIDRLYTDWCSQSLLYQYVQIDFKNPYTLTPTSYTFVVRNSSENDAYNPINWTVQGLFGGEWKNISEVRNSTLDVKKSKTFTIDKFSEYLNSIRFMQISMNSLGPDTISPHSFCLVELEIFGIIRKRKCYISQFWSFNQNQFLIFLTLITVT